MLKSTRIKLHAAAVIFASRNGCSAQEIADTLKLPVKAIYRYTKEPEWENALNTLQYAGDRQFPRKTTRDPLKDSGELVAEARALYTLQRRDGRTHKKAVTAVVEVLGLKRRRINEWAERYNWQEAP